MYYPYISVYEPNETDFSHNGLRILMPTDCPITETLNGEYSLSITHPLDEWGCWQYIRENYIIKAQGQLFRIYRKTLSMSSDGSYEIKADALHITYDLNYYFIKDARPTLLTGERALNYIVTHTYTDRGNITVDQPTARFNFASNIKPALGEETTADYKTAYYEKMSVTKALIGADNCFVNVWGGEIYRDNFNITINKRRGKRNAFSIRYGVDMTEIQHETDYSGYCSSVYYEATVYNEQYVSNEKVRTETLISGTLFNAFGFDATVFPVPPMQAYNFELNAKDIQREIKGQVTDKAALPSTGNIDGDLYYVVNPKKGISDYYIWSNGAWKISMLPSLTEMKAACEERAKEYMLTNCQPSFNYRIIYADLKNYDLYKDFIGLQECNLGDAGTIYHELLGINVTQQIVKKTINGITGETISIELGSLRRSFMSDDRTNGSVDSEQSDLIINVIKIENTWENLGNLGYEMQDLNYTWADMISNPLSGGAK